MQDNQTQQQTISTNKPSRATYRLSAVIIDNGIILGLWSVVCLLIAFIFNIHILIKNANNNPLITVYSLIGGIISIIYFSYFHAHDGASPGKKLYGLRVIVINTSSKLTYSKSFLRELVKSGIAIIPIVGGLLNLINGGLVVFSKTKQGVHDSLVKSQVIEVGKPISLWKQLLLYLLLLAFWAASLLILVVFVFSIGPK
jgi:uncharacterized RDD family membrane protein YckC